MGLREEIEDARGAVANHGGIMDVMNFGPRLSLGERMLYVMDLTVQPRRRLKDLLAKAMEELFHKEVAVRGLWLKEILNFTDGSKTYELLVVVPPGGVTEKQDELVEKVIESWVPFLSVTGFAYGVPPDERLKFNFAGVGPIEWRL